MTGTGGGRGRTARDVWAHVRLAVSDAYHRAPRPRVPEPMVVDDPEEVRRFSEGGAVLPAMRSVYDFNARAISALTPAGGRVLELGVGAGHALAHFLLGRPDATAVAVDLSEQMLKEAGATLAAHGLTDRVALVPADATDLPSEIRSAGADTVSALWTLHQLPDDAALDAALRQIAGIRDAHGAAVWLLDFHRLAAPSTLDRLLSATEPGYPEQLRADAIRSEAAAFTDEELRRRLAAAGLADARCRTSSPLRMLQAAWLPGRPHPSARPGRWAAPDLDAESRRKAALLQRAFKASDARPYPRGLPRP